MLGKNIDDLITDTEIIEPHRKLNYLKKSTPSKSGAKVNLNKDLAHTFS